uniref:Uncharacterized protein n=1 Tax=viral metagenome TaxID=1070528 RepID=A0A6C0JPK3_9ZZZZ
MGDCTIGKELKQSTCRYVKKCKPGWVRNEKYICRKTLRRIGKRAHSPDNKGLEYNYDRGLNVGKKLQNRNKNQQGIMRRLFGNSSNPSPPEPKLSNSEMKKLFESPNEVFNDEPSNLSPKVVKKPKKLITGKVRPLLLKPKSRKNFRALNDNLKNSPNEAFDLKKHKRLQFARLQKTKDLKLREKIKQKEREAMNLHARKIATKYNVLQNAA